MFHELLVRRPLFHALEKQLRVVIPDNETRFRIAGDLLLYTENAPRLSPDKHVQFRAELERTLGKTESDRLISMGRTLHGGYRFMLTVLKVVWLVLFVIGTWGLGRILIGWGWSAWTSLLAAAFVVGAILEVAKWLLAWRIER